MTSKSYRWFTREDCRLCKSSKISKVLSFPRTPPANQFVREEQLKQKQELYPLDVWLCSDCGHAQLVDVVNPEILFSDYVYVSGTSKVFVRHFEEYAHSLINRFSIEEGSWVLDIGSNDGTLLSKFKEQGLNVLGIDPAANIATGASQSGIPTITGFFTQAVAQKIRKDYGKFRLVTANNVFAHIDDIESVVKSVDYILDDNGLLVFEVSYLDNVISGNLFDTIYHEHLDYHAITPLLGFFSRLGMTIIDAERVPSHGGSIRVYVQKSAYAREASSRLSGLISEEESNQLMSSETFLAYSEKIDSLGIDLMKLLAKLKSEGKSIAGYGAPAKATTLMYKLGINSSFIDYIIDDSPLKQGLYSPGLHIPVVSSRVLDETPPDYLLILAWNFADSIMKANNAFSQRGGKFIIPVPEVVVR